MPTYFQSQLLDTARGPDQARRMAENLMRKSAYLATDVAHDVLNAAADGKTYIVLPREARSMWRLKRWMPERFLKLLPRMRERVTAEP
jgi:hypothetical protein